MRAKLWWVDVERADLRESNLTGAYLTNAFLEQADLRKTYLAHCNLDGCTLRQTSRLRKGWSRKCLRQFMVSKRVNKTLLPSNIPEPPTHWYDYEEEVHERELESARSYDDLYRAFIGAKADQPSKYRI